MTTLKNDLDSLRKKLNRQQTELRKVMEAGDRHKHAIRLFFRQHADLHGRGLAAAGEDSLQDQILQKMAPDQVRKIPGGMPHSAAWCLWHMARIEDIAMNMLVAGSSQVLSEPGWHPRLCIDLDSSGNAMEMEAIADFSKRVDLDALLAYRLAVGRRTQQIVAGLNPGDLHLKVEPARIRRILDEGAVAVNARGIAEYWGRRTNAGLLLMPATRHNLVHLNEMLRIKRKS